MYRTVRYCQMSKRPKISLKTTNSFENKELHPLNPYRCNRIDFSELLKLFPELLTPFSHGSPERVSIDFSTPAAQYGVLQALLQKDFNVIIPPYASLSSCGSDGRDHCYDRLIPPLPNRLNYICWLKQLTEEVLFPPLSPHHMLDIGIGASCIYPLLATVQWDWKASGSDIDKKSLTMAQEIINMNEKLRTIELYETRDSQCLQQLLLDEFSRMGRLSLSELLERVDCKAYRGPIRESMMAMGGIYAKAVQEAESGGQGDFLPVLSMTMTNPPFYDPSEQIQSHSSKQCTGSGNEMITVGGELIYIAAMILDSLLLQKRVGLYSTMVGKRHSWVRVEAILRQLRLPWIRSIRFTQGKTMRWGIAWSYYSSCNSGGKTLPPPISFQLTVAALRETVLPTEEELGDSTSSLLVEAVCGVIIARVTSSLQESCVIQGGCCPPRALSFELHHGQGSSLTAGVGEDSRVVDITLRLTGQREGMEVTAAVGGDGDISQWGGEPEDSERVQEQEDQHSSESYHLRLSITVQEASDSDSDRVVLIELQWCELPDSCCDYHLKAAQSIVDNIHIDILRQNRRWRRRFRQSNSDRRREAPFNLRNN